MGRIEAVLGIMLGLVALYLVLSNASNADTILKSLANAGAQTFGVLQGRTVSGSNITVS